MCGSTKTITSRIITNITQSLALTNTHYSGTRTTTLLKKRVLHRCFSVKNTFLMTDSLFDTERRYYSRRGWKKTSAAISLHQLNSPLIILRNTYRTYICSYEDQKTLTLSWRRTLPHRNQSIDLPSKSLDWFLYNNGLRHERVNDDPNKLIIIYLKSRNTSSYSNSTLASSLRYSFSLTQLLLFE